MAESKRNNTPRHIPDRPLGQSVVQDVEWGEFAFKRLLKRERGKKGGNRRHDLFSSLSMACDLQSQKNFLILWKVIAM
jgi:hypothetical protein